MKYKLLRLTLMILVVFGILIIWETQVAKAWTGDPSNPHVIFQRLIQSSGFNRLMN